MTGAPSSFNPIRASQVSRRTEAVLSAADNLASVGRDKMWPANINDWGFTWEIRSNLVLLINRYQDEVATLQRLMDMLTNVDASLEKLGMMIEPESQTP